MTFQHFKNINGEIEKDNIRKIIPYGDDFLFVDKVLSISDTLLVAQKIAQKDDPVFTSHFRDFGIYPGALLVEGLGQAASILVRSKITNHEEKDILAYLIHSAQFKKPIFPGSIIQYEIVLKRMDEGRAQCSAKAIVLDKTVAEVEMTLAIVNKNEFRGRYAN